MRSLSHLSPPSPTLQKIDERRGSLDFLSQLHQVIFLILFPNETVLTLRQLTIGDLITELQLRTLKAEAELEQTRKDAAFQAALARDEAETENTLRKSQKHAALLQFLDK